MSDPVRNDRDVEEETDARLFDEHRAALLARLDLRGQAVDAVLANRDFLTTAPSQAEVIAQVRALTRQMNNVIALIVKGTP